MNAIENIVKMVTELKKELEEMPETKEAKPVSREEFTLLLSGISTCRKAPGIPVHMGYEELKPGNIYRGYTASITRRHFSPPATVSIPGADSMSSS